MKKFMKLIGLVTTVLFFFTSMSACSPTSAPPKDPLSIISGGKCNYTVIRPENCVGDTKAAAIALKSALAKAAGGTVSIKDDALDGSVQPEEYEILVGITNREETAAVLNGIKYGDYAIEIAGKKLVITAYREDKLVEAVNHVIGLIEKNEGDFIFGEEDQVTFRADYELDSVRFDGVSLKGYTIIVSSAASEITEACAQKLQSEIAAKSGVYLPVKLDTAEETEKEILLGNTTRSQSRKVDAAALGTFGYSVTKDGSKIVIKTNDDNFTVTKLTENILDSIAQGTFAPVAGKLEPSDTPYMTMFCFTDVHNNFAMLEPTNLSGGYIVRKNVDAMIDRMLETEGAVDLVMVGGDLMSDYPHWNKSGNWPYRYFIEYRKLLIDTFARLSKDGKVVFNGGNHDYGQGEAATDGPGRNGSYNSSDFYFGKDGMKQTMGELAEEDMYWIVGKNTGVKYLIGYHYTVNNVHIMGIAPDPDLIWSKQGNGFTEEAMDWLNKKLDEIDPGGNEIIFLNCHYHLHTRIEAEDGSLSTITDNYNTNKLTLPLKGHSNLFLFYGHTESWNHGYSVKSVIHYNTTCSPVDCKGTETESTELLAAEQRSFNAVNMGHFRPGYYQFPDMFCDDAVTGYSGYENLYTDGSTATPRVGQGMYVQVFDDRIVFTLKNIGDYEGLSTEDILEPYTVWLYK